MSVHEDLPGRPGQHRPLMGDRSQPQDRRASQFRYALALRQIIAAESPCQQGFSNHHGGEEGA